MFLAKNIRYLRKKNNMGQEQLAELLGKKTFTTIQKWESGDSTPQFGDVYHMANLFQVDIDDFVKIDIEKEGEDRESIYRRIAAYYDALTQHERDSYAKIRSDKRLFEYVKKLCDLPDDYRQKIYEYIEYQEDQERKNGNNTSDSSKVG